MSSLPVADAPPDAAARGMEGESDGHGERSVGQIREDFGSTVAELKQKYGTLLEQRDRRIQDLAAKLAEGPPEAPKRRVLIVDNAASTGEIVNHYLEGLPVEVVRVAGDQAPDILRSQEFDAIMIEAACVIEPGVSGLALCRQLCESGDRKNVVAMSSRPGNSIRTCVEEAGAMFLRKPFERAQLVELMRGALVKEKR